MSANGDPERIDMATSDKAAPQPPTGKPDAPQTLSVGESKPENSAPGAGAATAEPETDEQGFIAQKTDPRVEKGPFLVGRSDVGTHREITRHDFESVGIDQDTLVFEWTKDFKIPLKNINPDAVKFLTENEYGFSVSDE